MQKQIRKICIAFVAIGSVVLGVSATHLQSVARTEYSPWGRGGTASVVRHAGKTPSEHRPIQPQTPCLGSLSGSAFPDIVPAYLAWGGLFDDIHRLSGKHSMLNETRLGSDALRLVSERVRNLQADLAKANVTHFSSDAKVRDNAVAETILDARDDLIRSLAEEDFRLVQEALAETVKRTFLLPAPGQRVTNSLTESACRVTVKGHEYPHLIRDQLVWRAFFMSQGGAAHESRLGPGNYSPSYMSRLETRLPLPPEYMVQVLDIAVRVQANIKELPPTEENDAVGDQLAIDGRDELIRLLPKPMWIIVRAEVHRKRSGMFVSFPSPR